MQNNQTVEKNIVIDEVVYQYRLRRSRKAKNIILHVELDGAIELVVPWRASFAEAEKFVNTKTDWLKKALVASQRLQETLPQRLLETGEQLPFFDDRYQLVVKQEMGRKRVLVRENSGILTIMANNKTQVRPALIKWYRLKSRDFFTAQSIDFANKLGVRVVNIKMRDTKTQWGSCNKTKGILTYHWRLALGPQEVARYVAAHEVAHLKLPNHSPAYWRFVEHLATDYKKQRLWLKRHGHTLAL